MANKECDREISDSTATIKLPVELLMALSADGDASRAFDCLEAADQREYIDWVGAARKPESRAERAAQAVQMLRQGDGKKK
ncbi:MAG TPA: YdeI/OmpD-associated family protein [Myxococcota bacterium]|nr:YdeI/OmpD-associated family protein [Myxococcota bacterium]HRY95853.1 YdeI/OmpD-associated family protein [Myxococcota bacterium]